MDARHEVGPDQARAALDAVERGRRAMIDRIGVPGWYWGAVAGGWVALGLISDLGAPWLSVAATLVFGAAHASVAPRVVDGRHGRGARVGRGVPRLPVTQIVLGGLVGLVVVTVALALAAQADGARHPATAASLVVAVVILLGGPLLMAVVRRHAAGATGAERSA